MTPMLLRRSPRHLRRRSSWKRRASMSRAQARASAPSKPRRRLGLRQHGFSRSSWPPSAPSKNTRQRCLPSGHDRSRTGVSRSGNWPHKGLNRRSGSRQPSLSTKSCWLKLQRSRKKKTRNLALRQRRYRWRSRPKLQTSRYSLRPLVQWRSWRTLLCHKWQPQSSPYQQLMWHSRQRLTLHLRPRSQRLRSGCALSGRRQHRLRSSSSGVASIHQKRPRSSLPRTLCLQRLQRLKRVTLGHRLSRLRQSWRPSSNRRRFCQSRWQRPHRRQHHRWRCHPWILWMHKSD
mmetsp:Transcript_57840/g.134732  ORF Transcript_57840/g.134732 Transcript_57840/m.134732 type:complete len:289 (+) Transcript_57840:963-1829(+)